MKKKKKVKGLKKGSGVKIPVISVPIGTAKGRPKVVGQRSFISGEDVSKIKDRLRKMKREVI